MCSKENKYIQKSRNISMEEFKADIAKFGVLAQTEIEKDEEFKNSVLAAIEKKDLALTLQLLQAKAKDVGSLQSWFTDDMKEFAYVLFVYIINRSAIPKDKALKMAATVYNKITGNDFEKKTIGIVSTNAASTPPIKQESAAPGPKKPSLFLSSKIDKTQQSISIESPEQPPTPIAPTPQNSTPQTNPAITMNQSLSSNSVTPSGPKVSSSIPSSPSVDSKDLVIENLKKQVEEYKKALGTHTYENLTKKIDELSQQLLKKDEEIKSMKEVSSAGGTEDEAQLKTKLIVLQSKLRQKEKEIEELKEKGGGSAQPTAISPPVPLPGTVDPQEIEILKRQLEQERRTVERLREQLNAGGGAAAPSGSGGAQLKILQAENAQLREEIRKLKETKGQEGPQSNEVQQYKELLAQKENQIAQMEAAMARTGKGSTYLTEKKYQRKIEELESQIKIMKKAEQEMKQRFEEAMLKTDFKEDEGW